MLVRHDLQALCNKRYFHPSAQALAERRRLRKGSGGSSSEALAAPAAPPTPVKDAKARVRFAVGEGEAPGDNQAQPEVCLLAVACCI